MTAFLVVLHILVCVFLILFVLLQPGARGGVGAAFGGAGGATVFGGRGANTFLAKLTAASAVVFMLTSISLSYFGSSSKSIMNRHKPAVTATDKAADKATEATDKPVESATDKPAAAAPTDKPATATEPAATDKAVAPVGDAPPANPG